MLELKVKCESPEPESIPLAKRIVSTATEDFEDHLGRFENLRAECQELSLLVRDAEILKDQQALRMLQATLDDLRADLERVTNLIKINFVGRLVRPKTIPDLIFEVQSYEPRE